MQHPYPQSRECYVCQPRFFGQEGDDEFPTLDEAEAFQAQDMSKLSGKELEEALEDLHGVSGAVEQDPYIIDSKLAEFDSEVSKENNKIYEMAESRSKDYVENREFRLQFLRAESFDVKAATKRFMLFFEQKLLYFGLEKLTEDITLSDLSKDSIEVLESGVLQELADTDISGRVVFVVLTNLLVRRSASGVLRALYYFMVSIASRRSEAQTKGMVAIFYNTSTNDLPGIPGIPLPFKLFQLRKCLPNRSASTHVCVNGRKARSFFGFFIKLFSSRDKARVRCHVGSDMECQYKLKYFGIPLHCFPVDADGNFNMDYHKQWMQQRRDEERGVGKRNLPFSNSPVKSVFHPGIISGEDMKLLHADGDQKSTSSKGDEVQDMGVEHLSLCMAPRREDGIDQSGRAFTLNSDPPHAANVSSNRIYVHPFPFINGALSDMQSNVFTVVRPMSTLAPQAPPLSLHVAPQPRDVLFGRGRPIREHPGNIRFREVLGQFASAYEKAEPDERRMIALQLTNRFVSSGARFLKSVGKNRWVHVHEKVAYEKVSQCFRTFRKER